MNDLGSQYVSVVRFPSFCSDPVDQRDEQEGWNLVETEHGMRGRSSRALPLKQGG